MEQVVENWLGSRQVVTGLLTSFGVLELIADGMG
jgi:hypothetical protein